MSSCWLPKDSSPKDENRARLDPYLHGQVLPASDQPAPLEPLPLHSQLLAVHDRSHREVRSPQRISERDLENPAVPPWNARRLRPSLSVVGLSIVGSTSLSSLLACCILVSCFLDSCILDSKGDPLVVGSKRREADIAVNHSPIARHQCVIDRNPNNSELSGPCREESTVLPRVAQLCLAHQ